jgi:Iap family predicted aminopeptidase
LLRDVVESVSGVGSHPLGFRVTGTPEERQVTDTVAGWMRAAGLEAVAVEPVPVVAWRFRGASVTFADARIEAASLGGAPPTRRGGVTGSIVYVRDGRRAALDRLDVGGRVALVDWRSDTASISDICLELGLRGCVAVIVTCLRGGARFQGRDALGTSVVAWHAEAPPAVTVRAKDALEIIERSRHGELSVRVELNVQITQAQGRNVVGVLPGRRKGAPLVVGAHHDGWFRGAFDNASGVASMLAIAHAAALGGWLPTRPVCFVSHTAEEYGRTNDAHSWCLGAWEQVARTHPRWGATVPFYLNVEASGHPGLPLRVEGPAELRRLASRVVGAANDAGRLPRGWVFGPPVTGTEAWPFQLRGIPSLSVYNWHRDFARTDYHTTNDTSALLDYELLADMTGLYLELLMAADAAGEGLVDHRARAREVRRLAARLPDSQALEGGADAYARSGSRRAFSRLARRAFAVDAGGTVGYLPEQAARDVRYLDEALARIGQGDHRGAARSLTRVGDNHTVTVLSRRARTIARRRRAVPGSWAAHSHLTASPDLFAEIAALRGERTARPFGAWVERSLRRARDRQARELARRIDRLAGALSGRTGPPVIAARSPT